MNIAYGDGGGQWLFGACVCFSTAQQITNSAGLKLPNARYAMLLLLVFYFASLLRVHLATFPRILSVSTCGVFGRDATLFVRPCWISRDEGRRAPQYTVIFTANFSIQYLVVL